MSLHQRPFGPASNLPNVQNTIAQSVQGEGPGPIPALQSITSTAETLLTNPANTALALSCAIPPNTNLEQIPWEFEWSGYIKTTANGNITLKVYEGTAIVSGNLMGSSGAIAQNTASAPFWANGKFIFDSVSGKLEGTIGFFINGSLVATVAISNVLTGFSNTTSDPVVQFCASITSSGAASGTPTTINTQNLTCG
jgi:hypothetical protein